MNLYCITLTDYFSKWAEKSPIPTKVARHVAAFLYKMFLRHVCPLVYRLQAQDDRRLPPSAERARWAVKANPQVTAAEACGQSPRRLGWSPGQHPVCLSDKLPGFHKMYSILLDVWKRSSPSKYCHLSVELWWQTRLDAKVQRMLELQEKLHVQAYANTEKVQAQQKLQYEAKDNTSTRLHLARKCWCKQWGM